ncbi:hypothetical protein FACS1894105_03640 [Clostridia bacterium]|nr:hypothetical protein FACS1894105_03640 [Clostridia bacterium]
MENKILEANREAWNEATGYHQKARKLKWGGGFSDPDFTVFDRDCDKFLIDKLRQFIGTI